jgi:hypothetical protein
MPAELDENTSDADMINTDIEELKDAAESIQSLSRVLKLPQSSPADNIITAPLGNELKFE